MADLVAAHHSLYIKCLFKTIRCQELRDELLMRNCSTGDGLFISCVDSKAEVISVAGEQL